MEKVKEIIPLLAIILLIGCAQVAISGCGNLITQEEAISGFDNVDISSSF